jgi:hypothetical protein
VLRRFAIALSLVAAFACRHSPSTGRHDGAIQTNDGETRTTADGNPQDGNLPVADGISQDAVRTDAVRDPIGLDEAGPEGAAAEVGRDSTPADSSLASFCTGDGSRLATNGYDTGPAIRTYTTAMDCCDGITIEIITATFSSLLYVSWLVPATGDSLPVDIDLSGPSSIRSFHVAAECQSRDTNCQEVYTSGFVGRLRMSRADGAAGYDASLCVHVEESADSPHATLHSFDLYLPHLVIQ